MSVIPSARPADAPSPLTAPTTRRTMGQRSAALLSSTAAAVLGVVPHVLHHAGPLAGAALLAGTAGTMLFGMIGLLAAIPFLLRVHRHCGSWTLPATLLATFVVLFSLSAFVIGPAITGSGNTGQPSTNATQPAAPSGMPGDSHAAHHR